MMQTKQFNKTGLEEISQADQMKIQGGWGWSTVWHATKKVAKVIVTATGKGTTIPTRKH